MFIDTHTHLNFKQFDNDREQVVKRAQDAGVKKMIVVGSDLRDSTKAIELAGKDSDLFAAVGLHPSNLDLHWRKQIKELSVILTPPLGGGRISRGILRRRLRMTTNKVVAIGEVGLDYFQKKNLVKKEVQIEALEALIDLAKSSSLPLILHCREAEEDFLAILKNIKRVSGVWHCFQGSKNDLKQALNLDLYLSFTGIITFSRDYDEIIRYASLDRIMIETDCPFLAPEPYRGKRNEPAYVVEVARRIAEIKDVSLYKVAEQTTKNAKNLFKI